MKSKKENGTENELNNKEKVNNEKINNQIEEPETDIEQEKEESINKLAELEKQKKEKEKKIKDLQDSLLRKVAEFENYKRRTENDQFNLIKYAAESFILKVLPIYDDLKRSVNHLSEETNFSSIKEGLELILNKFTKTLEEQGIKKIETLGKEFNVEFHEALLQQPSNEFPDHTVIQEVEAGYLYKDKVIRHAKVIVSQNLVNDSNKQNENQE